MSLFNLIKENQPEQLTVRKREVRIDENGQRIVYRRPKINPEKLEERLKLPGSWRHIITTNIFFDREVFVDINVKVERALCEAGQKGWIKLLNESTPADIVMDAASSKIEIRYKLVDERIIRLTLKDVRGVLRIRLHDSINDFFVADILRSGAVDLGDDDATVEYIDENSTD